MNIHDRLRFLRKYLGLTTRAFGASINMSGGAITNMEKGARNITDRTIRDICREYDINPEWLISGKEPMKIENNCIDDLDVDVNDEVKQMTLQYNLLNENDKELIKTMIDSLYEKVELQAKFHNEKSLDSSYPDIPDTPEECEKKFPPKIDENSDVG